MTLNDWCERFGWVATRIMGAMVVPYCPGSEGGRELFDLTDYRVSSCVAGSYYLIRR